MTLSADKAPAYVPASTLKSAPRVEPLTCAIGAEVSNVNLGSASRDPDLMAELQEAADRAARGLRDREEMRQACKDMDRISEDIRRRHGILDIGVPAIRQLRDSE